MRRIQRVSKPCGIGLPSYVKLQGRLEVIDDSRDNLRFGESSLLQYLNNSSMWIFDLLFMHVRHVVLATANDLLNVGSSSGELCYQKHDRNGPFHAMEHLTVAAWNDFCGVQKGNVAAVVIEVK